MEEKIILKNGIIVHDAVLLTLEEAMKLDDELNIGKPWWLKSAGRFSNFAVGVDFDGFIYCDGELVDDEDYGLRPALVIDHSGSKLTIDDKFRIGKYEFQIISEDRALCTGIVKYQVFRKDRNAADANHYEKSDIKKALEDWFRMLKHGRK